MSHRVKMNAFIEVVLQKPKRKISAISLWLYAERIARSHAQAMPFKSVVGMHFPRSNHGLGDAPQGRTSSVDASVSVAAHSLSIAPKHKLRQPPASLHPKTSE